MSDITVSATQVRTLIPSDIQPSLVAGEALTVGNLVQIRNDGVFKANNTTAAGVAGVLGIVMTGSRAAADGSIVIGETVSVLTKGRVFVGVNQALTTKGTYYTSANAGRIADATSTNARIIGNTITSEILDFNPSAA